MDIPEVHAALAALQATKRIRQRRLLDGAQGANVSLDGRVCRSFASNDYLGLANHPGLAQAAIDALNTVGLGAGASHLLTGHHALHQAAEIELAGHAGLPAALLFSTGYMANIGVVTSLLGRGDAVFADKLNHASLVDAAVLSRAEHRRYRHGDLNHLEDLLRNSAAKTKMIATDAVFSMDGDIAPIPELFDLAERYHAWLYLDDAHGFGVLGQGGRGVLERFGLMERAAQNPSLIYMATLGKALGVSGAFVAGAPELIEWLVNKARTYIYTTAMPPALSAAVTASLKVVVAEGWRRERLLEHIACLRNGLVTLPWRLLPSETPIQPVQVGSDAAVMALTRELMHRGIFVPAIRPPTVPEGTSRLRISLSAGHTLADVEHLVDALRAIAHG
ncbi:MAG: 8-amino-7-oxononanoate synthase [Hydrogenophilales bacterium]|nr:8-amino-7-oxononanoate synthase [Hydrogenophilales bacterium]